MTTREMLEALSKWLCKTCGGSKSMASPPEVSEAAGEPAFMKCPDCQVDGQPTGLHPVALVLTENCTHWVGGNAYWSGDCPECHGTGRSLKDVHLEDVVVAALHSGTTPDNETLPSDVLDALDDASVWSVTPEEILRAAVTVLHEAMEAER